MGSNAQIICRCIIIIRKNRKTKRSSLLNEWETLICHTHSLISTFFRFIYLIKSDIKLFRDILSAPSACYGNATETTIQESFSSEGHRDLYRAHSFQLGNWMHRIYWGLLHVLFFSSSFLCSSRLHAQTYWVPLSSLHLCSHLHSNTDILTRTSILLFWHTLINTHHLSVVRWRNKVRKWEGPWKSSKTPPRTQSHLVSTCVRTHREIVYLFLIYSDNFQYF